MIESWKKYYHENKNVEGSEPSYVEFAFYAVLRGKDWRKCFAPNTMEHIIKYVQFMLLDAKEFYFANICKTFGITFDKILKMREAELEQW